MKKNEIDINNLEEMKKTVDETLVRLDELLKNNLLALNEYSPEDFNLLLEEMGENFHDVEMLNLNIAAIESYLYEIKKEQNRLVFQTNLKEEDIYDIFLSNLNTIISTHTAFFTFLMITSKNSIEFLTKVLITILISKNSYNIIKSYFLSNQHKEKMTLKLSSIEKIYKSFELDYLMHTKTKEYYEKEIYFQRQKLKEIAPKRKEFETEEEFLERSLPKHLNIGGYEIGFKPANTKTRKREK